MKNIEFSVLLSIYYREKTEYAAAALQSIFEQTILPAEVILVKDGILTEELEEVIHEFQVNYSILKVIPLPENIGLGNALNEGLKHCSFELVARMDTDDICYPYRFEKQIQFFLNNSDLDVVGSTISEFIDSPRNIISFRKLPEKHDEIAVFAKSRCPLNHPSVMFRKSRVLEVGGYKHFYLFEDYFLWMRMLKAGAKFHNIQESLLYFRANPEMIKRRGGSKYAKSELEFQKELLKQNMISYPIFVKNISIRIIVRIIPNALRSWIYKKNLRK